MAARAMMPLLVLMLVRPMTRALIHDR